jgi:guanylate kinase
VTNKLSKLNDFKRILENYKPSLEVIDLLNELQIVLLVAPAAAGRNTIVKNLIMTGKYYYLTSETTRLPRVNNGVLERDGGEYWFRNEDYMLQGLRQGLYLGASIIHEQQVSAISIDELRRAASKQLIAITDIDINGADFIADFGGNVTNIFVLPPDFDEWMRRLDSRGAMDPSEKRRRLQSALHEISDSLKRNYFRYIVNWDLRATCEQLHEGIISQQFDQSSQDEAKNHAAKLIERLKQEV